MRYRREQTDEEIDGIAEYLAQELGLKKEELVLHLKNARKSRIANREMWHKAHEFPRDILTRRY